MTDLRQAAQQALDAWDDPAGMKDLCVAMDALRTALAMHQVSEFAQAQEQAEPVAMRMPKVGDKVICLEDESLGEVVSLTAGGSPDIVFDDGSRGTYLLREFAELFSYVAPPQQQAEPVAWLYKKVDAGLFVSDQHLSDVEVWNDIEWSKPLYTTPPQRQWVGLEPEEILDLFDRNNVYGSKWIEFSRTVEAKLKEKNSD